MMINRPIYLNQLINLKDKEPIKVITGIRRCGKSSLLVLFEDYLKSQGVKEKNIFTANFESFTYEGMNYKELYEKVKSIVESTTGKVYLLFDEIQKIKSWELAVNAFRVDFDVDIYITGSNAYLLSSQLSTHLSGRYVQIKMQPLSFKEFLTFYNLDGKTREEKFELYLRIGGMPGLKDSDLNEQVINQTLDGILSTVIMKDVINQSNITNTALLQKIILFLTDSIGCQVSVNKIKNVLVEEQAITKGTTTAIIDNYIKYLENAFIFYGVKRYDIKGKEFLRTQGKYYIVDIGLRNNLLGLRNRNRGFTLENIVFLELKNRGYDVSIGKINNKEVDFIATSVKDKKYIQVTETLLSEETRLREFAPLKSIQDNYEKIILTTDTLFTDTDEEGIKVLNIIDWLLEG